MRLRRSRTNSLTSIGDEIHVEGWFAPFSIIDIINQETGCYTTNPLRSKPEVVSFIDIINQETGCYTTNPSRNKPEVGINYVIPYQLLSNNSTMTSSFHRERFRVQRGLAGSFDPSSFTCSMEWYCGES
jgi:hypothetical protein